MAKIIIDEESSLENSEFQFDGIISPSRNYDKTLFKAFEPEQIPGFPKDFPPSLIVISEKRETAIKLINGNDEVELFFLYISSENPDYFIETLLKNRDKISDNFYLIFLTLSLIDENCTFSNEKKKELFSSVKMNIKDPFLDFIVEFYELKSLEETSTDDALFVKAVRSEKKGDPFEAFEIYLEIFRKFPESRFLFNLISTLSIRIPGIDSSMISEFIGTSKHILKSMPDDVSGFFRFMLLSSSGSKKEIEPVVRETATLTNSLFILHTMEPWLKEFGMWGELARFYRMSADLQTGKDKVTNLELLADILENRLARKEDAQKTHLELLYAGGTSPFSVAIVTSFLEKEHKWSELMEFMAFMGEKSSEGEGARFFADAGNIALFRLNNEAKAESYYRESIKKFPFTDTIHELTSIYINSARWDDVLDLMELEYECMESIERKKELLDKMGEIAYTKLHNSKKSESFLKRILDIDGKCLSAIKKLARIYYRSARWKDFTGMSSMEIALTDSDEDIVLLLNKNASVYINELNDFENGAKAWRDALKLKPDFIPSIIGLEKLYIEQENFTELENLYNELISNTKEERSIVFVMHRKAALQKNLGKTEAAAEIYESILKIAPENKDASEQLRVILNPKYNRNETNLSGDPVLRFATGITSGNRMPDEDFYRETENDFWKYIYLFINGENIKPLFSEFSPVQKTIYTALENKNPEFVIDCQKFADSELTLFSKKLFKNEDYSSIYTILNNYIALKPEKKKILWSLFLKGKENSELTEILETLFVSDIKGIDRDALFAMLKSLYIKTKDIKTLLFTIEIVADKIKDLKLKYEFVKQSIDEIKPLLEGKIETDALKLLYEKSIDADKNENFKNYINTLMDYGMFDQVKNVYRLRWQHEKNPDDAVQLLKIYIDEKNLTEAQTIVKEVLDLSSVNEESLENVLDKALHAYNDEEKLLFEMVSSRKHMLINYPAFVRNIFERAFEKRDLNLCISIITQSKESISSRTTEEMIVKVLQKADETGTSFYNDVCDIFIPQHEQAAIEKLKYAMIAGTILPDNELELIEKFSSVEYILSRFYDLEIIDRLLLYFVRRKDIAAIDFYIRLLIKRETYDKATMLIEKFPEDNPRKKILESMIFRQKNDITGEKSFLINLLTENDSEIYNYAAARLKDICNTVRNKRGSLFFYNILSSLDPNEYPPISDEWENLSAMDQEQIYKIAGMNENELKIISFASALAVAASKKSINNYFILDSANNRDLMTFTDKIFLTSGLTPFELFYDPYSEFDFKIEVINVPIILFGQGFKRSDKKRFAFNLLRRIFLINKGFHADQSKEEFIKRASSLFKAVSLKGAGRVEFIRRLKPMLQENILNQLKAIEDFPIEVFENAAEKLYTASLLYSFSAIPDPVIIKNLSSEERKNILNFGYTYFTN